MDKSPDQVLASIAESARNVKFGKGVVSKTTYVAALIPIVWAGIIWRWSENIIADAGLLVCGLIVTAFAAWYIISSQRFAEKNPAQALLDGAELLEWRRLESATSAMPLPPPNQPLAELPPAEGHSK